MKKPVIAITMSKAKDKAEGTRDFIPSAYAAAVSKTGGLPMLIPNDFPPDAIPDLLHTIDGILLSGGGDVSPSCYEETDRFSLSNVRPERDAIEISLAKWAVENDLPLLGICRGEQVLNVALGGTLYQHVPVEVKSNLKHNTPDFVAKDFTAHQVTISRSTHLHQILEVEVIEVNSRHHQAVQKLGKGLTVSAFASDGLVEAIEQPDRNFCIGVQWHPENLQNMPIHKRLFDAFIQAASQ